MTPTPQQIEMFMHIINKASEDALVLLIEQLATELGHPTVAGLPVRQFYDQERDRVVEEEISHYADTDMAQASVLRVVLQRWREAHRRRSQGER